MTTATTTLTLAITVRPDSTVLLRCLQILGRRGYVLESLETEPCGDGTAVLHCRLTGPERWHRPIVPLLERVVNVLAVRSVDHD